MVSALLQEDFSFSEVFEVLVEAVPNLSTSSQELVRSVAEKLLSMRSEPGCSSRLATWTHVSTPRAALLDVHFDADHARSVWTIAGDPVGVVEMVVALADSVLEGIDLRSHRGVHPRMGAVDVVPFVPLGTRGMLGDGSGVAARVDDGGGAGGSGGGKGETLSEGGNGGASGSGNEGVPGGDGRRSAPAQWARWASRRFAEELWYRHRIPSYFYGRAATAPSRSELPAVRRRFEDLAVEISRGWIPDVGDPVAHPRWGAAAVGVRDPLVAFNVVLATSEIEPARRIVAELRRMREEGALPGLRALAFYLQSRERSQVSMNLTRPEEVGVEAAFSAVESLADREGVGIEGAEVVGLAPRVAIEGCSRRLLEFCPDLEGRSLEDRLIDAGLTSASPPS